MLAVDRIEPAISDSREKRDMGSVGLAPGGSSGIRRIAAGKRETRVTLRVVRDPTEAVVRHLSKADGLGDRQSGYSK